MSESAEEQRFAALSSGLVALVEHVAPVAGMLRLHEDPQVVALGDRLRVALGPAREALSPGYAEYVERLRERGVTPGPDGLERLLDAGWWVAYNGEGTEGWADGHAESGMLLLSRAEALARLEGTDA